MLANYLPILLFILIGLGLGAVAIAAGKVLAPHRPDEQKLSPYECGFEAFEDSRMKFDVRYYLCLLYTSPSPRDATLSRMPSSA